ncbi:MAG TPA: hypothetical protein VKR23_13195 [Gaiellaceae bacterium]|nr:hypothetical protein [Gaiellaceae bacterium]
MLALAAVVLAAQPNLSKLVLQAAAVGKGYVLVERSDGKGTAQRTLDLCGTTNYASESLRVNRLQVDYLKPMGTKQGVAVAGPLLLSNEVVTYKGDGASEAMKEVAQHVAGCPDKPIAFEGQPPLKYKITRLADSKLLKGYLALRVDVSGTYKGKKVSQVRFAVYQRSGNILSGVYSYAEASVSAAQQEAFVLHAAEASAKALRATVPTGPSA